MGKTHHAEAKQAEARILPTGATHYLPLRGKQEEPIPEGVSIRSKRSVQIEFMWEGRRCTESLLGRPTDKAIQDAVTKRESVLLKIRQNSFKYEIEFPNSRRVRQQLAAAVKAVTAKKATMRELFRDWLALYAKENPDSANTLGTHDGAINSQLNPKMGDMSPTEVTREFLIDFRAGLVLLGLSESRIANIMTPLRGSLDLALERRLVDSNCARQLSPTKRKRTNKVTLDVDGNPLFDEPLPTSLDPQYLKQAKNADPLEADERKSVFQNMWGQVRNIFLFAIWTGLRTGELIALRWCDVDEPRGRILVRLSFSKSVFTNTKGRRARWVDLRGPALEVIKAQRALTGAEGRWVFHNPRINDRWQNSQRLRVHWLRALAAAGVRHRKPYQCRHTYASLMVSAGEACEWIAEQMGHLDGRLIAAVYGKWIQPENVHPGQCARAAYQNEWNEARKLIAHNQVAQEIPEESAEELLLAGDDDEEDEELVASGSENVA